MKKFLISGVFSLMLAAAFSMPAFAEELIVGGQAVGIQISTEGVLVAGLSEVETAAGTESPAKDAGVKQGDLIIKIDGKNVYDSSSVIAAVESAAQGDVKLSIKRGEKYLSLDVSPAEAAEGKRMLGLLLRDGLSGIGTLTWLEPDSGSYGALGHSVNDTDARTEVPIRDGRITSAQIVGVKPGEPGAPGELNGAADLSRVLGSVEQNTQVGIFGKFYSSLEGQLMETGLIAAGPASLISTVSGSEKRSYSVEINRVYKDAGSTHAMLTVTDPELLDKTGGIVQGMSGSPIIQNGKIVAAVTHVFVNMMRLFSSDRIMGLMDTLGLDEDTPIDQKILSGAVENAQKSVESRNFRSRKNVLEYDNVMNTQREVIYGQRQKVLAGENLRETMLNNLRKVVAGHIADVSAEQGGIENQEQLQALLSHFENLYFAKGAVQLSDEELRTADLEEILYSEAVRTYELREKAANEIMRQRREARGVASEEDGMREIERVVTLQVVDEYWMDLIDAMDDLKQGIHLRSYGQHDPVVEYKQQGYEMFEATVTAIREETVRRMFLFRLAPNQEVQRKKVAKEVQAVGSGDSIVKKQPVRKSEKKVGPNDPCPCGSGKKYKKCCMHKDKINS